MKRTLATLLFAVYLFGEEPKTPTVSEKTIISYKDALLALSAANKDYDDFPANVKKALEEILKRQQQAIQIGQAALNQALADCGAKHQLDSEVFSKNGAFVCVPKVVAESELKK